MCTHTTPDFREKVTRHTYEISINGNDSTISKNAVITHLVQLARITVSTVLIIVDTA